MAALFTNGCNLTVLAVGETQRIFVCFSVPDPWGNDSHLFPLFSLEVKVVDFRLQFGVESPK